MRQTRVGHRYAFGCRFASDGNLARMFCRWARSSSAVITVSSSGACATTTPHGSDDQRPAVGRLARERLADLRRGGDVELVLDRARAHEHVPVILAGRRREVRRHRYELRAFERQDAVELGEANVVTDREPDAPVLDLRDDGLVPRLLCLRLAVDDAPDLHVEEVDLPVRRDELAFGIEDEARVGELLASLTPLGDRAADQRDPVRPRPPGHRGDRLAAVEWLRSRVVHGSVADRVPLLRQNDDVGPGCSRLCDEALCLFEVRALVGPTRHLNARDTDPVRHTRRIASPRWSQ